jgi:hypothetical protein
VIASTRLDFGLIACALSACLLACQPQATGRAPEGQAEPNPVKAAPAGYPFSIPAVSDFCDRQSRSGRIGKRVSLRREVRYQFASYVSGIHNRLHPRFDAFLQSLQSLPSQDPLARANIAAQVEIVIDGSTGALVEICHLHSSGVPAFDAAVVKAVTESFPVAPVPPEVVSGDGRVYLSWEFFSEPYYACSPYFSRPYKLSF